MPIPRHSITVASVQLAQTARCEGVTELRVHGVGGSPPNAILGDLAPEQASGDQIAGFYRSGDHRASPADQSTGRDADRHVEAYSWGGLTSRSKVRVLWLALLPFLFGNLAGWMCSARTFESGWRFRLHRLAHGLCGLALTVNAALIAALISADLLAYEAVRAGRAHGQWWLAPLGWHDVARFPARQVLIGMGVPVLFLLLLAILARRSWRYEKVRPPFRGETEPPARQVAASTLRGGLADPRFWDGEGSVRSLTRVHLAAAAGFLAVVLGVTAKQLTSSGSSGAAHWTVLWWVAVVAGAVAMAGAVGYLVLDTFGAVVRRSPVVLLIVGAAGLVSAGGFAWLQPAGVVGGAAELPGMASVIGWTALAIAVALALSLVSMLLGLRGSRGTLAGGPFVTLMMGFVLLNTVLLGAGIWLAHLVGPVTTNAADAAHAIYVPYLITAGVPLAAWAAVAAVVVFGLVELGRWWRVRQLPEAMHNAYFDQARAFVNEQNGDAKIWYESALEPDQKWERKVARTQFMARVPLDASWLLWGVIVAQVAVTACVWQLHLQPPVIIRNIGLSLGGLILPALMGFLYAAWSDPTKRRTVCVLWDVGTFWPRSYHPLSPPCYAERAVPELQRRMWWLHDNGGRVVLIAHSQGAMLATATLAQPACRADGDRPSLITFGSPVVKLYAWGFPAYVTQPLLTSLAPRGPGRVDDWRNYFYPTDPIGGPVAACLSPADAKRVDQALLDPEECWYVYGQPEPASQGHSGYWADPRVWAMADKMAATEPRTPAGADPVGADPVGADPVGAGPH